MFQAKILTWHTPSFQHCDTFIWAPVSIEGQWWFLFKCEIFDNPFCGICKFVFFSVIIETCKPSYTKSDPTIWLWYMECKCSDFEHLWHIKMLNFSIFSFRLVSSHRIGISLTTRWVHWFSISVSSMSRFNFMTHVPTGSLGTLFVPPSSTTTSSCSDTMPGKCSLIYSAVKPRLGKQHALIPLFGSLSSLPSPQTKDAPIIFTDYGLDLFDRTFCIKSLEHFRFVTLDTFWHSFCDYQCAHGWFPGTYTSTSALSMDWITHVFIT